MKINSNVYLLFSIGPVQEFIAAGRKTRDLFSGSLMLSYLSAKAIEFIHKVGALKGLDLKPVFPAIKDIDNINFSDSSIPNRFLFKLTGLATNEINELAEDAKAAVEDEFTKIVSYAKKQFTKVRADDNKWNEYWDEQKNNFLEIYWAATSSSENYDKVYSSIEALMGKRKALRNFNELKFGTDKLGQPGVKCSIIINLSAIHPTDSAPNEFWRKILSNYKDMIGDISGKEYLSAIALAKRFFIGYLIENNIVAKEEEKAPSTTTFAAASFNKALIDYNSTEKIETDEYVKAVRELQKSITPKLARVKIQNLPLLVKQANENELGYLEIDGDFLHEEAYSENRLRKEYQLSNENLKNMKKKIENAKNAAEALRKSVNEKTGKSLSKYYSVIYFDGDNMGKWLSGNIDADDNDGNKFVINEKTHEEISNNLRMFSSREGSGQPDGNNVYDIVEGNHLGKVIYSGGDDVLAFTSLEDSLDIAQKLRVGFSKCMGYKGAATGSAGIAIAHHQMNLQQVLQYARKAEKYAKDTVDRDAFSFALLKRSGISLLTGFKWNDTESISFLEKYARLIRDRIISTRLLYDLINESAGLSVFDVDSNNGTEVLNEIKRLLLRHSDHEDKVKKEVNVFFKKQFQKFYVSMLDYHKNNTKDETKPINKLCELLEVAQFIGKGGER